MASFRFHTRVAASPEEVWAFLTDVTLIPQWFPGVVHAMYDGEVRVLTLGDGAKLRARVVTNDPLLRRFQYQFLDGFPIAVEQHLGTLDVIDDAVGALIIYSQQVEPQALADVVGPAVEGGIHGISAHFAARASLS